MSDAVRDGFESYYTEKLWQLVPEVYRNEDGLAANPGVLRRIVELIGAEAAQSRREIDRLWEDQHVETCDDWTVHYIGDLVGARLVSSHDRRGRRVDVANAVKFRRRRGTPDLLDALVRAMSGWDVVLVEGFRRLALTRHRLDAAPRAAGFFTGTLTGGTADLRSPAGSEVGDGPFDEYFHTLDARLLRGRDGQFGINKLNFHLYRRLARTRHRLDAAPRAAGFFTGTLTGGTADLRSPAGSEVGDGPFDEYFHTLDARLLRGRDGQFGINKLNFHLYRLQAFEMEGVDPVELTDPNAQGFPRAFTVDPSGRDIPLFIHAEPPDPDAVAALPGQLSRPACGLPFEWEVTQEMRCRLLGNEAYEVTASNVEALTLLANPPTNADVQALFQILGVRFKSELALRRRLRDLGAGIAVTPRI